MYITEEQFEKIFKGIEQLQNWYLLNGQGSRNPISDPWLSVEEVCAMLKCSKRFYQYLRSSGKLEYSRLNNKIYTRHSAVEKLLIDGLVK